VSEECEANDILILVGKRDQILANLRGPGGRITSLRSRFGGKPRELSDVTRSSVSQGSKQPATGRSRRPGKYRPEAAWWYQYPTLAGLRK
jgi:hypothetical protein